VPSTNYAYVNGNFVPETEARVSIFDRGFLHGDAAFETMRVYEGKIFLLEQHLARLSDALTALQIPAEPPMRSLIPELVARNAIHDGVVRLIVTRGQDHPTTVVTAQPRKFEPRPLRAIIAAVRIHAQLAQLKTANRLPYTLAKLEAEHAGVDEALLLNESDHITEFSTANIFIVKDGTLLTPPIKDGTLPGVTRAVVLELAKSLKIPAREESLLPDCLNTADEVFATNSLIEIAPVSTWSRRNATTTRLQNAYRSIIGDQLS
jgi:branched-chain amino acid aminotransferase